MEGPRVALLPSQWENLSFAPRGVQGRSRYLRLRKFENYSVPYVPAIIISLR